MAAAHKKVVLRTFGDELGWGYMHQAGFVETDGTVRLIDPAGRVISHRMDAIKTIAYVKDFNLNDPGDPERLGRRSFPVRPRLPGLWVRLFFRDGDTIEGVVQFDLGLLQTASLDAGIFLLPPDSRSNTQRLFVPHLALSRLETVTAVARPARRPAEKEAARQGGLFDPPEG